MSTSSFSRRGFLKLAGGAVASTLVAACGSTIKISSTRPGSGSESTSVSEVIEHPTAEIAWKLLQEGNQRYALSKTTRPNQSDTRRAELAKGQAPFAIIFGCVDSRVPPELVFDRGLGDLFVVRTAAHTLDRAALGSIQFGVEELHIPLIVVMGHEKCGAVSAAIEAVEKNIRAPDAIDSLVQAIKPAIEKSKGQTGDKLDNAVKANTALTVEALKANTILGGEIKQGKLMIVGTRYDLDTGAVELIV